MGFWVHSFKARRERDEAVYLKPQRDVAAATLAGWRFVLDEDGGYHCYDPCGSYHGVNASIEGGARYALWTMDDRGLTRKLEEDYRGGNA